MALTRTPGITTSGSAAPTRWLLPVIMLGNVLNIADVFIVNVALPTLSRTLHAGSSGLELVSAGYSLAYACFLVLGGRLGDTFGRRRLFLTGMAGFTIASAVCGLAPTTGLLIAARAVQGMTAALMIPQVLATIQVVYQGTARQRALAIFGAVMGSAAAVAQILGGALISADLWGLSWRPAFLVNVPVGIIGLLAARRTLPESRAPQAAPVDRSGTVLLGGAVLLLLVPLALGRDEHWPLWGWIMLAAAPFVATAFAITQRRSERRGGLPLLPPSLLRVPGMLPGLGLALICFAVFGGMMLTTTVAFQFGLHYSPIEAGVTLTPYAVAWLAGSLLSRNLVARYGRYVIVAGAVLWALAMAGLSLQAHEGFATMRPWDFAPALIGMGLGQSLVVIPALGLTLAEVPAHRAGVAAGVFSTVQQSAVALGTAGFGTLFFTLAASHGYGTAVTWGELVQAGGALLVAVTALGLPGGK